MPLSRIFKVGYMYVNAIYEYKILAKIFEFTIASISFNRGGARGCRGTNRQDRRCCPRYRRKYRREAETPTLSSKILYVKLLLSPDWLYNMQGENNRLVVDKEKGS